MLTHSQVHKNFAHARDIRDQISTQSSALVEIMRQANERENQKFAEYWDNDDTQIDNWKLKR